LWTALDTVRNKVLTAKHTASLQLLCTVSGNQARLDARSEFEISKLVVRCTVRNMVRIVELNDSFDFGASRRLVVLLRTSFLRSSRSHIGVCA